MSTVDARGLQKIWIQETPTGTVNGSNVNFTLSQIPVEADAMLVFLNGIQQKKTTDWTVSGTTLIFVVAPSVAQQITVQYVQEKGGA